MKAKSIHGRTQEELQMALEMAMSDAFVPTLAFVFIGAIQDRIMITRMLKEKGISIFGATTSGEYSDKGVYKDSAAILLLDLDPSAFCILHDDLDENQVCQISRELGNRGIEKIRNPGFIICASGIHQDGRGIINGILEATNTSMLIGGMAGDDTFEKTTVFSNEFCSHSGLIALVLDQDKIIMKGRAISGWKPIGTKKKVTRSEDNWIMEIDGQPALDVLKNFLGLEADAKTSDPEFWDNTLSFPFEFYFDDRKTMLVPPIRFNPDTKAILVPGGAPEGIYLKFTRPPDFEVIDRVIQSAKEVKKYELEEADALIIFSCMGRRLTLGPLATDEVMGLKDVWSTPIAGFFCYGEFGPVEGDKPDFVGTTCSWVALKEQQP